MGNSRRCGACEPSRMTRPITSASGRAAKAQIPNPTKAHCQSSMAAPERVSTLACLPAVTDSGNVTDSEAQCPATFSQIATILTSNPAVRSGLDDDGRPRVHKLEQALDALVVDSKAAV